MTRQVTIYSKSFDEKNFVVTYTAAIMLHTSDDVINGVI